MASGGMNTPIGDANIHIIFNRVYLQNQKSLCFKDEPRSIGFFYVDDFCLFVRNFYTVNIDGGGAKVFHVERIGSRFPSLRVRLALLAQDDTGGSKQ